MLFIRNDGYEEKKQRNQMQIYNMANGECFKKQNQKNNNGVG